MADVVGRPAGYGVGFVDIEVADSLFPGIQDDGDCRIADHAAAVGIEEFPALVDPGAVFVGKCHQRVYHVADHLGIDDILQGELAAEHIPAAEDGAFLEEVGRVGLAVATHIFAGDVAEVTRVDHGVIQRGVEHGPFIFGPSRKGYFRQSLVPQRRGLLAVILETVTGEFGLEIGFGALHADEGNRGLHEHLVTFGCWELGEEAEMFPLRVPGLTGNLCVGHQRSEFRRCHILKFPAHAVGDVDRPDAILH